MKIKSLFYIVIALLLSVTINSCTKDLDIENNNDPDKERVLSNPEDVETLALSGFYNWFMANNSSISPRVAMWVMADQGTCSWANSGMLHLSSEPRTTFNNSVTYTYANIFETYYEDLHANLYIMNSVLEVIDEGMEIITMEEEDHTDQVKAISYFIQGISLGYLGLVYDKTFIMKQGSSVETATFSPYTDVIEAAIVSLDSAIMICENSSFDLPMNYINGSVYDDGDLKELANSFAARFLVYGARNKAANDQIDWARVKSYADAGVTHDLAPYMDGVGWNSWFRHYTVRPGWARIDCRIINMMDPSYPWYYPGDGMNPDAASSADNRLASDFNKSANNMKPERGYYHYGDYEYVRYPLSISTTTGESPTFLVTENDLIRAEAMANLGDIAGAVQIINAGSRVTRGGLDPLAENISKEELLDALYYERDIELIQTGFGIAFFDMRRRDMLQYGTMLQFPVPGKELMILEVPDYTFGGESKADGINTSNGGWFPVK